MNTAWLKVSASFDSNVESVFQLLDFDHIIIDVAVDGLRGLALELEAKHHLHSAVTLVNNRASLLENIKKADSLRPKYEAMFNQCVVLLVSYFDSAIHGAFREGIIAALKSGLDVAAASEALTVSWRGLERTEGEREAIFADLLVSQKSISFQDMKSIARAFKDLLGVSIERSPNINNLVLGQAARHVIVHAGSVIDDRMVRQVAGAKPRSLMENVAVGQAVRFTPTEIVELATSMKAYMELLCSALNGRFDQIYEGSA
jgi:hypothetical protein